MSQRDRLEAIVVYLGEDGIHDLRPKGGAALRMDREDDLHPGEVVVEAVSAYGLSPFLVHSTSWRMELGSLVLTFVVAVEPPAKVDARLEDDLVERYDLARGHVLGPPPDVHVDQVAEHGLRHLAWLMSDDPAIRDALPDWLGVLSDYRPEPFRAFGSR
jgi:hypothetical protein